MVIDRERAIKILNKKYSNCNLSNPEEIVKTWKDFVKQVKNGKYNGNENEYWNDLDTRKIIEEIGYADYDEVKEIDDEFKKTLIYTDIRNWGYGDSQTDDWWNFGYPKTVIGYLKKYFESDRKFQKNNS